MKNIKFIFLILVTLIVSFKIFAGNEKGNGGYVVKCKNPTPDFRKTELLDFTEGRLMRELTPSFGSLENATYQEKVLYVISRLAKWSPTRAKQYRGWADSFMQEAKFLKGIELGDIGDSDHIVTPVGCDIVPAINQREPTMPLEKRYIVNQDLWDSLDTTNQAGLVLHELIYRELKLPTSVKIRYINSALFSSYFESLGIHDVISLFLNSGFVSLDLNGVLADLTQPIIFFSNDNVQSVIPVPVSNFNYKGQILTLEPFASEKKSPRSKVEFYENDNLKSFVPFESVSYKWGELVLSIKAYPDNPMTFWENGNLQNGMVVVDKNILYEMQKIRISFGKDNQAHSNRNSNLLFYEDGSLNCISDASGEVFFQNLWVKIQN